ncbi:hypothetical protein AURDEDRAFT_169603 [Auricularia subglabra TFB-10046 SS5]|uniref:Uncharacterized protein n=1 Tax=Auricularia subglabra (strain TFB-10046 / SS5) TaxID=717982 RepID=J0WXG5_AURST|nr:hypothetical protein AURDEDRAFT_169603 [Auricularia subglabra TFB-10046 SS5]
MFGSDQGYVVVTNNDTQVTFNPTDQWQRLPSSPDNYMSPSYALTPAQGATASLTFNGTCVYYYSDKKSTHGAFNVQIDDSDPAQLSSFSETSVGEMLLYASPVLSRDEHVLLITNLETNVVAVSFFIYRPSDLPSPEQCADPSTPPVNLDVQPPSDMDITVKAGDQSLLFAPSDQWEEFEDYKLSYSRGASIEFTFLGTNVWYTSDMNWDHGSFSVTLDGSDPTTLTSFSLSRRGDQVLYGSPDLSPGKHTLRIFNEDNKAMGIENFIYRPCVENVTAPAPPSSSFPSSASSTGGSPTPSSRQASVKPQGGRLSDGAFIGIAVGVVSFVHLSIFVFFVVRQLRRARRNNQIRHTIPYHPQLFSVLDLEGMEPASRSFPSGKTEKAAVSTRWVSFPDD